MKNYISVFLILCLLFSSCSIVSVASPTPNLASSESRNNCTNSFLTESIPMTEASQSLEFLTPETIEEDVLYKIDETNISFLRKITAEILDLQGCVSFSSSEKTIPLNLYFAETNANRFDIIDIAYKNAIINKEEKIDAYCMLLEQKKIDDVSCLNSIITTLHYYALYEVASQSLVKRINSIFPLPKINGAETRNEEENELVKQLSALNNPPSYCSSHFTVYYPTDITVYPANSEIITSAIAAETANYFESLYNSFHNMGFLDPVLDTGETKYSIVLNPNSDPFGSYARTSELTIYGNTCSFVIVIYDYQSLTNFMKETIAHEYFHAIEFAYHWSFFPGNIREAFADWASICGAGMSTSFDDYINSYLESTTPMSQQPSYGNGLSLYPLTIQKECGVGAIVDIYEEAELSERTTVDFSQFKTEIVNPALASWSESFNSIYLKMAGNNYDPSTLYTSVHPNGASAWTPRITSTTTTQANSREAILQNAVSGATLDSYTSNYHIFTPDIAGKDSKITIKIVYSGTNAIYGVAQCLYKTEDGTYTLETIPRTASLTFTYTHEDYGNLEDFCIITSSLGGSGITYSIDYAVERGTSSTVEINNMHRYTEYIATLNKGEYYDLYVTFQTAGRKLIQTFGTLDSYIILYNANGTQLTYNDNSGYESNALLSYSFAANTQYKIRVVFYNKTTTGKTKLTITTSSVTSSYENINPKTDNTSTVSEYLYVNSANLYTYKFTTEKDLTVNVTSNIDVYLYIIDPRSTAPMRAAQNTYPQYTLNSPCLYNDDYNTTNQSQITKTFEAGVPYYVIVSRYSPTTGSSTQYYMSLQLYS